MKRRIIALIPARGGSKSIPKKNIRLLNGKPLISYTIWAAKRCKEISEVYVSTEDKEIARISQRFGAKIVPRPMRYAIDTASSQSVFLHAVKWLQKKIYFDVVVILQPTSPLRNASHISEAIRQFYKNKCDTAISVTPETKFRWIITRGIPKPLYKKRQRRQDMKPVYYENGAIFVTSKEAILENGHLGMGITETGKISLYIMGEIPSLDLNNPFDFWLAEQILRR